MATAQIFMIFVYVLKSIDVKFRYVGIAKNLKDRMSRHNDGRSLSTKPYAPFRLIHLEQYDSYITARAREKFLKSGAGRKFLDTLLSD